jgi:hypothetical protein
VRSFGEAFAKQATCSLFPAAPLGQEGRHCYEAQVPSQAIDATTVATVICNGSNDNINNISFSGLGASTQDPN